MSNVKSELFQFSKEKKIGGKMLCLCSDFSFLKKTNNKLIKLMLQQQF